jgi:hypothetical protein
MIGLCSGVGVASGVGVGGVVVVGDGLIFVSIVGIVLCSWAEREAEIARIDVATMQIATKQVIATPIHLHLKRDFALFLPKCSAYTDVRILISGSMVIASVTELYATG